jgi:hypothetical protein
MIVSHVKIIAFQLSLFCKNYRFSKTVLYIINRKIHGCLEIPDLFRVLNMIISAHPCIILYVKRLMALSDLLQGCSNKSDTVNKNVTWLTTQGCNGIVLS